MSGRLGSKGTRIRKRESLELKPIGMIHYPYKDRGQIPCQWSRGRDTSRIEVLKEFEEGLQGIERFSHIIVIYWFHRSEGRHLLVKTPWDEIPHGLLAARSPDRPCPLGLTVAALVAGEENRLNVKELDAIDGTPLLDIKPCIPSIEEGSIVGSGWLEGKPGKERS